MSRSQSKRRDKRNSSIWTNIILVFMSVTRARTEPHDWVSACVDSIHWLCPRCFYSHFKMDGNFLRLTLLCQPSALITAHLLPWSESRHASDGQVSDQKIDEKWKNTYLHLFAHSMQTHTWSKNFLCQKLGVKMIGFPSWIAICETCSTKA